MKNGIHIELINACKASDRLAQKQLYQLLLPYLNVVCKRYLASDADIADVLQETFVQLFKNIQQYDSEKAAFKTWATRIAINNCLKSNQQKRRRHTFELVIPLHEYAIAPEVIRKMTDEELIRWFKQMPEPYYQVFNLYVVDGFSHAEIASLLGIDEALSRKRLSRGRAWLKKKLPKDYPDFFDLPLKFS